MLSFVALYITKGSTENINHSSSTFHTVMIIKL